MSDLVDFLEKKYIYFILKNSTPVDHRHEAALSYMKRRMIFAHCSKKSQG
jgi:hypothetical protein